MGERIIKAVGYFEVDENNNLHLFIRDNTTENHEITMGVGDQVTLSFQDGSIVLKMLCPCCEE